MKRRHARLAPLLLLAAAPVAFAQITTVPMEGVGNEWVKELDLRGRMDWEWIDTFPDRVFFATRHDSKRAGDIVTMWTRVEYKHPQNPLAHKSAVSRDDWDCRKRQRSTTGVFFYKWNNLQDDSDAPEHSTNLLPSWEKIEPGTTGETLFNFACSISQVTPVIKPEP
ncbi:MAG TPA: surface-adhesin E family protein [Steroidobacteraceae bacterium]